MARATAILIGISVCFTLLVAWFAWSTLQATPPLATATLRSVGFSTATAIEQLIVADNSLQSLEHYSTPDIAYFALIDNQGTIRFHTNPGLIGQSAAANERDKATGSGLSETRERLGTGEEVYLLRTALQPNGNDFVLVLALHTYQADMVVRRAETGVSIVTALTVALWGLTTGVFLLLRRDERRRRAAQRREELALLGEMSAIMAHEIRTPLAGIKGFAQLAQKTGDLGQAQQHAGRIVTQSLRLERLVDDLLSFARSERDERQSVDLAALVAECAALLREEAANQGVTIEACPPRPVHAPIMVDRIVQLLLNLMKNALQAMPDGGMLKIALEQNGKSAIIRVTDTGAGIAPENLEMVFAPFWTNRANGTGLGLALCRKVAEEHGGCLTLASQPGHGSIFTLTLPLHR